MKTQLTRIYPVSGNGTPTQEAWNGGIEVDITSFYKLYSLEEPDKVKIQTHRVRYDLNSRGWSYEPYVQIYAPNEDGTPSYEACIGGCPVLQSELPTVYADEAPDQDKFATHDVVLDNSTHKWVYTERRKPSQEELISAKQAQVRRKRDILLGSTDKYLVADYPLSAEQLEKVKSYRTALRDVTEQASFAESGEVEWPEKTW